jgi:two-component system, LuxR family, response regulator FixJ
VPPESASATVFIVDDDPAVCDSLRAALESTGWSVRTWDSAEGFLREYDRVLTGCLLLDLRIAGTSGIDVQKQLCAAGSRLPIIFLTAYGDVPTAVRAMKNGAFEFLEKPVRAQALIEVISRAVDAHTQRQQQEHRQQGIRQRMARLSPREREVLGLLVRGESAKQIAQQLCVDPKTVHTHRARVLAKLGMNSAAELLVTFAPGDILLDDTNPTTPTNAR